MAIVNDYAETRLELDRGSFANSRALVAEIEKVFRRETEGGSEQSVVATARRTDHSWIGQDFTEFRELELQLLIGELESSLRGGGKKQVRKPADRAGERRPE